jgi:restriction system protein
MAGPQFVRYFPYVIEALVELGNSGRPSEVREWIAKKLDLSDDELNETMSSGNLRFENQVHWARFYLAKAGYLDSSKRGVWSLTEKGIRSHPITKDQARHIFRETSEQFRGQPESEQHLQSEVIITESTPPPDSSVSVLTDYRAQVLEVIRNLPPSGFENLCKRLLRESGFQQVEVTGRSGDGGIDGKGILQINPFLSMQVIFQSKRYGADHSVGSREIRDFRGAMAGRTDKGIFLTTSTFTADARREAFREGVPPIELVDAEKLINMLEDLELGLIPKKVYEINNQFFEEFNNV